MTNRVRRKIAAGVVVAALAVGTGCGAGVGPRVGVGQRAAAASPALPSRAQVLASMRKANDYWIKTYRSAGANKWHVAVYLHGDMAAYEDTHDPAYRAYALAWAKQNGFGLANDSAAAPTRNADDQVSGQVYLDLYRDHPQRSDLAATVRSVQAMTNSTAADDWWWVDALYMGMPVFARLAQVENRPSYVDKMYALYHSTRDIRDETGLYDKTVHLWSRDQNHPGVFWSRGNGWAFAALAETLTALPASAPHHAEYVTTFQDMAAALAARQRSDGFWNSDLGDPKDFGGPESSGTALFTYGIAWGIRHGLLDRTRYQPVLVRAWHALTTGALHSNGLLGYVQHGGGTPAASSSDHTEDFGVGAFLLAGDQVAKLVH